MPSPGEDRELTFTPINDLTRMILSEKLSPVELVEAVFRRIGLLNPRLNAFLTLCEEEALRSARRAADEIVEGNVKGPLRGMPVGIKDLYDTKGVRTTYGSLDAGLRPLCPGSDGGGSIRIPSSLCGLFGLKPTYGRVPYDVDPVYGSAIDFICHGPMTRTVRDGAFLLNVMSGPDERDYNAIRTARPDYMKESTGNWNP